MATISQSFTGAEQVAKQFPQAQSQQLVAAAQQAFVDGKTTALLFAALAAAVGFVVVLLMYPGKKQERATYAEVTGAGLTATPSAPGTPSGGTRDGALRCDWNP